MRVNKYFGGLFFAFFVMLSNISASNLESPFATISLTTAKEIAQTENKYIFIDFYADWCVPCKWMDETTYSDKNVVNTLQNEFVSVKINIDDFDGYTLKEEYNVTVLPTVIVLDHNGKVVRRFEESMSPTKLKDVLNEVSNNTSSPTNRSENISPMYKEDNSKKYDNRSNLKKNDNRSLDSHAIVKTNKSYRVQVGVYTDYANTLNVVDNLNAKFDEPVVVLNSYLNNKTVYKIYVGDFDNIDEAGKLKVKISDQFGIKGFIKSFE